MEQDELQSTKKTAQGGSSTLQRNAAPESANRSKMHTNAVRQQPVQSTANKGGYHSQPPPQHQRGLGNGEKVQLSQQQRQNIVKNKETAESGEQQQMNSQMMKALKLFAKNHNQLEKISDPDRGNHRRVMTFDGRKSGTGNIPASTTEKCGGSIPSGPKFVNELVEKELSNYKIEVESKFKSSYMNNNYVFPRRKQVQPQLTSDEIISTSQMPQKRARDSIVSKDTSASPQSRPVLTGSQMRMGTAKQKNGKCQNESQQMEISSALFTKKPSDKFKNALLSELLLDDAAAELLRSTKAGGTSSVIASVKHVKNGGKHPIVIAFEEGQPLNGGQRSSCPDGSTKPNLKIGNQGLQSMVQSKVQTILGGEQSLNKTIQIQSSNLGAQPSKQNQTFTHSGTTKNQIPQENATNSFFTNYHQSAFNKTAQNPETPNNDNYHQQPSTSGIPNMAPQNNSQQNQQTTSIVINKPIVIQFQNKKITFKNHHHHHHHYHNEGGQQWGSSDSQEFAATGGGNQNAKSNPITQKTSPNQQLSPRSNTLTGSQPKRFESNTHQTENTSFHSSNINNSSKQTPNQVFKPQQQQQVSIPQVIFKSQAIASTQQISKGKASKELEQLTNHQQYLQQANNISQSTKGNTPHGSKKAQVNQILQQILSFDNHQNHQNSLLGSHGTSLNLIQPSPRNIEYATQQVQPSSLEDGSLGRSGVGKGPTGAAGLMLTTGSSFQYTNSIGRPRQSDTHDQYSADGTQQQYNFLAGNKAPASSNIMQNFGISKTQESKKPISNKDNNQVELNIQEHLRDYSNEGGSFMVGMNSEYINTIGQVSNNVQAINNTVGNSILLNNSSFSSNFRTQVPTGAKLIISNPQALSKNVDFSKHVKQYPVGIQAQQLPNSSNVIKAQSKAANRSHHNNYLMNISHLTSGTAVANNNTMHQVGSPTSQQISMTVDNTNAKLNKDMRLNNGQHQRVLSGGGNTKMTSSGNTQGKTTLKKKKSSIGNTNAIATSITVGSGSNQTTAKTKAALITGSSGITPSSHKAIQQQYACNQYQSTTFDTSHNKVSRGDTRQANNIAQVTNNPGQQRIILKDKLKVSAAVTVAQSAFHSPNRYSQQHHHNLGGLFVPPTLAGLAGGNSSGQYSHFQGTQHQIGNVSGNISSSSKNKAAILGKQNQTNSQHYKQGQYSTTTSAGEGIITSHKTNIERQGKMMRTTAKVAKSLSNSRKMSGTQTGQRIGQVQSVVP